MKHIVTLLLSLLCIVLYAQTDSTEIKLSHYKDLFIKGLITSAEYEQLKGNVLSIKVKPKETAPTLTSDELNSLQVKYQKNRNMAIGCFIPAGLLFVSGTALLSAFSGPDVGGNTAYSMRIVGATAMGLSVPLFITGGVGVHNYIKYKRQWKKGQPVLSFAPYSISLTF